MMQQYKMQYRSIARGSWVDSCSVFRGTLKAAKQEVRRTQAIPGSMTYRAVPVKVEPVVAKKKGKKKR
jgi:hypothetical protein